MNLRSLSRRLFSRGAQSRPVKPLRNNPLGHPLEALEDRNVPATLIWVGDVDPNWATDSGGDTNWSGDALPASGDTLVFDGAATGALNNDTTAGNTYSLGFTGGDYTINGNAIRLDQSATNAAFAIESYSFQGAVVATPLELSGASNVFDVNFPLSLTGTIGGGAGNALVKTGIGGLAISNSANSYAGQTTVDGGDLVVSNNGALGAVTGGTVVIFGSLVLNTVNYTSAEPLTLNGGSLKSEFGSSSSYGGAVTLAANSTIGENGRGDLTLTNTVDTDATGPALGATLRLNGRLTFQNTVGANRPLRSIDQGSGGLVEFQQDVTLGDETTSFAGVRLTGPLTFTSGGFVAFWDYSGGDALSITGGLVTLIQTAGALEVYGASTLTSNVAFAGAGDFRVFGAIDGGGTVSKSGAGTLTFAGANTYTGDTTIDGGTLLVNGSVTSDVTVNAPGILGGSGTITGNVTGTGTVAAGRSPGIMVINGDFTPTGDVAFEVNPPATTAGTDFDQIQVNGMVDLSGATLTFTGGAGAVAFASKRAIITNNAGDATTASASPAEGATVTITGNPYRIFYNSGTGGNDVRLIATGTPTIVYVDDSFPTTVGADIADADLGTTGAQEAVYGIDAFNTIAAALAAVSSSGTIVVNGGTYAETISLGGTRTLRIGGPGAAQAVTIDSLASIAGTTIQIDGTSSLTVGDATTATIAGPITDTGSLIKQGAGTVTLSGSNSYTGTTTVNDGTLQVDSDISSDVTVNVAGTLAGSGTITGNVGGTGTVSPGSSPGIMIIIGDFTPAGEVKFEVNPPATTAGTDFDQIQVNGAVDLSGATLTFTGSAGAVAFASKRAIITNDKGDATTASTSPAEGATVTITGNPYRIFYNSSGNDVRLIATGTPTKVYVDDSFPTTVGDDIADADLGTTGAQEAVFGIDAFNTIAAALAAVSSSGTIVVNGGTYAETISLGGTRTLRIGGPGAAQAVTIDSLASIAGTTIQIDGTSSLTVGDATIATIAGPITDTGSLVKQGAGTLTLSGTNTHTGTTTVNDGTLLVNGSITSNTTVTAPGVLGGNGTITGNVTGTGTVAAGTSPGILDIIGDFTPLGDVAFEVNPPTAVAGTDFDQITVTGTVDLSGATLTFSGAAGAVATNLLATIIANAGVDGTVPGAPAQGSIVTIAGTNYFLFYNGGDGNDVVLVEATQPTNVFVNDDWAGLNDGVVIADVDPLVAGPQVGVFGVNAFGDIAPALAAVAVGGTVEVLGSAAAGYGAFTLSNAATFVLANDTFFGHGTVTINGAISLDGQDFTPTLNHGAGTVNLTATGAATITGTSGNPTVSVTSTAANTGAVTLNGAVSAVLGVSLGTAGTRLDTIALSGVSTGTGGIATFSNGITTLNGGSLNTDNGAVALTAVAGVRTGASIAIDTEQGDDAGGGSVNLSAASVSSTEAGSNFTIDTGTTFAGGTGGTVTLGGFTNDGGHFILDLTIDTSATTRGDITIGAAARIGRDLDATGKNIASNATFTAGATAADSIDLDATGNVTDGNGAALNFSVPLGRFSVVYTTGTVEADTTTTDFSVAGDGNLTIRETDAINIQGASFGATRVFDLTTGDAVTQDATAADAVIGGGFRLTSAAGAVTLANAANDVGTLAANVQGTTFINDVNALTVGTVAGTATTDGIDTNGNDLTLVTGNLLTIGDATGGTDDITAAGAIVDLFSGADGMLEANAAAITAASLRVAGTGTQFELASVNTIATLAGNTTGGTVRFNNGTTALSIGSVTLNALTTDGVTTDGENLTLSSGALDVAQVVDAGAGTARFATQGGVTQTAVITAIGLGVNNTVGGNVDLVGATNLIGTFAANTTAGFVEVVNGLALEIGTVAADGPLFAGATGITTDGGTVDVATTGGAGSTLAVNAAIDSDGGDIGLNTSGGQTLAANVDATFAGDPSLNGDLNFIAAVDGVNQTGGGATGADITLTGPGAGAFTLNSLTNDSTGVFAAGVNGALTFRDANDLTLRAVANAVATAGGSATLFSGEDFTANMAGVTLVNAGGGAVRIVPGAGAPATTATNFTFNAEVVGSSATFGSDPAAPAPDNSTASTKFKVAASGNTLIMVFGSNPVIAQVGPGIPGDSITPFLDDPLIKTVTLVLDPFDPNTTISGTYTITFQDNSVRLLQFRQIEALGDLGYRAIVAQTGNMQYSIRLQLSQPTPFPGSLTGQALQSSPFVVSPNIVDATSTYSAPTLAFGRVNDDAVVDLVIANGSNDLPQVTVIDGRFLFTGQPLNLGNLPVGAVLAQFYAFTDSLGQPTFRGGLSVAVKSNGGNVGGDIVLGAGFGGGPVVQSYRLVNGAITQTSSFFAFESSFRGGVNVATGDYDNDGLDDVIVGTGPGGAPRVQVFGSGNPNAQLANFFAYDSGFRGGVHVAAGNFDGAGGDDIATSPGYGGGPHVRVFRNNAGTPLEIASFFAWDPTSNNGLQTIANSNNGIGSLAFGAPIRTGPGITDGSGRQELLVGSNRGTALQLRRFTFAAGATAPLQTFATPLNLFNELTQPGAVDEFGIVLNGIPILDPMTAQALSEGQLFDGGSVAGFSS